MYEHGSTEPVYVLERTVCWTKPHHRDRYLLSIMRGNSAEENKVLFDVLVHQVRIPDMTVLLTAPPGIITQRIRGRNATDPDLTKVLDNQERLRKMRYFLQRYRIPSMEIDTSNCTPEQI